MAPALSKEFLDIQATRVCRVTLKFVCDMRITYCQMHRTDKYSQHSSIIWPVWLNGPVLVYQLSSCGFEYRCFQLNFRYGTCFEKESLDIKRTIECRLTLKLVRDMIIKYSQIHSTDKYSQHSSIIQVFVYELSDCGFESRCCHLNFRCAACFNQEVP